MVLSPGIVRWGGWAGVVAGVSWVLSAILVFLATPQRVSFNSFSDYLLQIILLVAYVGTIVAILGLHYLQSESGRYGRLGAAGSLIAFIGYAIVFVVVTISILEGGASLLTVRVVGAAAVLIGSILLGAMTIRTRVLPWWCGVLLIICLPLAIALGDYGGGAVLGLLWLAVAYALLAQRDVSALLHTRKK